MCKSLGKLKDLDPSFQAWGYSLRERKAYMSSHIAVIKDHLLKKKKDHLLCDSAHKTQPRRGVPHSVPTSCLQLSLLCHLTELQRASVLSSCPYWFSQHNSPPLPKLSHRRGAIPGLDKGLLTLTSHSTKGKCEEPDPHKMKLFLNERPCKDPTDQMKIYLKVT